MPTIAAENSAVAVPRFQRGRRAAIQATSDRDALEREDVRVRRERDRRVDERAARDVDRRDEQRENANRIARR